MPQSYAAIAAVRLILARFPQYKYITAKVNDGQQSGKNPA